ncbi:MAG TPA: methionyl-tRNA formyltransferase [Candidatus Limnocylindrales bacterium]|nr:methionyl-tRNA formyltransferase [Candidatus Limnocylindrales bacterium]
MTPGPAPGRAADPVRTVFFGSGAFAVSIFEALAAHARVELVGIVTAPDRAAGRGKLLRPTPIALRARSMWAPLLQPARLRDEAAIEQVAELGADLGVLADYGQIVPPAILELPRHGILNVHPSLLPRHRGATPIPAAIASGDDRSGVTIFRMDDGIDTGPIVAQEAWPLDGAETAPELEARAGAAGAGLLARTLEPWLAGEIEVSPQGEPSNVTRPFRKRDARLDPALPARELERGVRSRVGWPGSFLDTSIGRVLVHRASVGEADGADAPGTLVRDGRGLALATADGRLVLDEVQLPGGKVVSGEELLRGHPESAGATVGTPS